MYVNKTSLMVFILSKMSKFDYTSTHTILFLQLLNTCGVTQVWWRSNTISIFKMIRFSLSVYIRKIENDNCTTSFALNFESFIRHQSLGQNYGSNNDISYFRREPGVANIVSVCSITYVNLHILSHNDERMVHRKF